MKQIGDPSQYADEFKSERYLIQHLLGEKALSLTKE